MAMKVDGGMYKAERSGSDPVSCQQSALLSLNHDQLYLYWKTPAAIPLSYQEGHQFSKMLIWVNLHHLHQFGNLVVRILHYLPNNCLII